MSNKPQKGSSAMQKPTPPASTRPNIPTTKPSSTNPPTTKPPTTKPPTTKPATTKPVVSKHSK